MSYFFFKEVDFTNKRSLACNCWLEIITTQRIDVIFQLFEEIHLPLEEVRKQQELIAEGLQDKMIYPESPKIYGKTKFQITSPYQIHLLKRGFEEMALLIEES